MENCRLISDAVDACGYTSKANFKYTMKGKKEMLILTEQGAYIKIKKETEC